MQSSLVNPLLSSSSHWLASSTQAMETICHKGRNHLFSGVCPKRKQLSDCFKRTKKITSVSQLYCIYVSCRAAVNVNQLITHSSNLSVAVVAPEGCCLFLVSVTRHVSFLPSNHIASSNYLNRNAGALCAVLLAQQREKIKCTKTPNTKSSTNLYKKQPLTLCFQH